MAARAHSTGGSAAEGEPSDASALRLDKWLWFARFFKSRTLAARICVGGNIRLNRMVVKKAHQAVRPGDVLTFPQGWRIRVVRVCALGERRGPVAEAQRLYEDLTPPGPVREGPPVAERRAGSGRPTKRDRRAIDRLGGKS